ncbi:T3SS effector HopA1 family protein [Nocardiopsis aegyptia]|uniref:T3SS effector HopA1 family protein n=1 Tax=Nocardiopsis aegyptia TaxID=220378 RepID=UPI00366AC7E5
MNETSGAVSPDLVKALARVEIAADLESVRVDGEPVEVPESGELKGPLGTALYDVLHARRATGANELPFHLRDAGFEAGLADAVPHERTMAAAELCGPVPRDEETVVVLRDGVRVLVPRSIVEPADAMEPGAPVRLVVSPSRPALSPGFFMVEGTRSLGTGSEVLRVYVRLDRPEHAPGAWSTVLGFLEERDVAYRAKILSTPLLYPRSDAVVVYLDRTALPVLGELADLAGDLPGTGDETSLFARRLAPGVSCAWEPDDQRTRLRGMSFGQHRAHVTAVALIEAAESGDDLEAVLERRLREANIRPENTYMNIGSPDME